MVNMVCKLKIGIIGGSGLNNPDILKDAVEKTVTTPFGSPSDAILEGTIEGVPCALLARHGRRHSVIPSDVNFRANIWALKQLGCTHILASNACGSLQETHRPGDFVILDQYLDRTFGRQQTFYGGENGLDGVLHMPAAEPFCEATRKVVAAAAQSLDGVTLVDKPDKAAKLPAGRVVYKTGSVVTINGPRFSSRFESRLFQSWGLDVINMTVVPEVVLAREAGLSYSSVAIVTDFCAWKEGDTVSVRKVLSEFKKSIDTVIKLFVETIKRMKAVDWNEVVAANEALVKNSRQDLVAAEVS